MVAAFMCPVPALAEEESADSVRTYSIDEAAVITSTKETNDLRTLPAASSKFTPQAVEANQIYGLKDLSAMMPNIYYIPDYGSRMTSAIYIRGIGARSSSQSIGFYVDNVPLLDKSTFDFELTDIRDIQLTEFTESGTDRMITNAGRARSCGVELSVHRTWSRA